MTRRTTHFQPAGMLISQKRGPSKESAPYSDVIQRYVNEDNVRDAHDEPIFGTSNVASAADSFLSRYRQIETNEDDESTDSSSHESGEVSPYTQQKKQHWRGQVVSRIKQLLIFTVVVYSSSVINKNILSPYLSQYVSGGLGEGIFDEKKAKNPDNHPRPKFVYAHPYVTSSYYTATSSIITLEKTEEIQIEPRKDRLPDRERGITSRLAIVRPFCEFDADALPTTFACWNSLVPCRAAEEDLGEDGEDKVDEWVIFDMSVNGTGRKLQKGEEDNWECETDYGDGDSSWFGGITSSFLKRCKKKPRSKDYFDDVPADGLRTTSADLFLFYSQTFSENEVAMHAVDEIMNEYFSPGGWSRCFDNIYAIEANIPPELDLYIPAAQEELYNWVNGPNRQFEAAFRIIQSGEWGNYDGFYLMEGDSVPVKNYWLDVILGEINAYRPFAVLGAQYDGDKWDSFYEQIPISLLHHTNGNGIYNTSHPLLERLVSQLEVEAPCPYNSIPYDYRMSQMWVEGTLGIVPKLAPKLMLNEEGQSITLSDNRAMFNKWANTWEAEEPYKFTKAIHNYASTNLIPRHLGPEYVIHGAKLYSPWDPSKIEVTLVVSEWFFDRSLNLIKSLDTKDHPFNHVIIMIPPSVSNDHDYSKYTKVPVTLQFRDSPDFMDLCSAEVSTKWFMITNAYHLVSGHVDLMFTPGKFVPVIPFTPATYPFCLKYPYCNEIVKLAQRWNPSHKQVVLDMDMLYSTKERDEFCKEWVERNGDQGEHLYAKYQPMRYKRRGDKIIGPKGPTGTDYLAYLSSKKKDGMYKMTDRSLYGARDSFVKVYRKEEKLDGMSEEELARRLGFTLMSNTTECSCDRFESEEECVGSGIGCVWRALFESCHPPEMIDDGVPICESTDAPTMSPTVSIDSFLREIESPTVESATSASGESINDAVKDATVDAQSIIETLFKSREHELDSEANVTEDVLLTNDDDAIVTVDFVDHSIKENTLLGDRNLSEEESSSSRNRLLFSSPDTSENRASEELLENNEIGQVLPLNDDVLSNFDSISLYAIMKTPGVSKMNWLSRAKNIANEDTREMSCPTWGPSIVPRIISDVSQSSVEFSSSLFLNLKNRLSGSDSVAPLIKSRLTESVFHIRARHTRHQLLEIDSNNRLAERTVRIPPSHEIKNRRIHVKYSDELEQLRIKFVTSSISKDRNHSTNARVTTYIEQVLPPVATVWGETLQIFRPLESLFPRGSTCGETPIPEDHLKEGVADADIVICVDFMEPSSCTTDSKPQLSICHFDQNMRPLFGSLSVCLADIDVQDRKVNEKEVLRHIVMLTQLVGGFLGLSPNLFKYFRNPETGQLWGERTVQLSCGNGDGVEMEVLLSNIIEQRAGVDVEAHYEIVTPTVRQVVRNHFDCQELTGARLSAPLPDPNNHGECTFFNLDLRFHFDEDMTPISQNAGAAFAVSPLSLALLEDSSWYLADFSGATTPTFGRGAGCGFLEDLCISDGKVPDYSAGFYCSTSDETPGSPTGCDYTHRNKAGCDLIANANPPTNFQYYGSNHREFGSPYEDVRYCPMRSKHLVSCSFQSMDSNMESLPGEFFDENSRCYETDVGSPVCLETTCNSADKTLDVIINGGTFRCSYNGQVINVELGYSIVCPRIAVVCPDLICPSNCSGKGVCDYCKYVPKCICDDQFDETPGCWAL